MPLSPSPDLVVVLQHTLNNVGIGKWEDDDQRVLLISPYDGANDGPFADGDWDYDRTAQLVTLEELDELIGALQLQRHWLADQPNIERQHTWCVTALDDQEEIHVYGPFTEQEAQRKQSELMEVPNIRTITMGEFEK